MHANALAMKYLNNEQILAKQKGEKVQSPRLVRFEQQAIENDNIREAEEKKRNLFGQDGYNNGPLNNGPDMSLATQAYMERYGIIEKVDKPKVNPLSSKQAPEFNRN